MAGQESAAVRVAVRLYRAASLVLPAEFRSEYGEELSACFARIVADARRRRGRRAVLAVTVRSMLDVATSAPKQHLAAARAQVLGAGGVWGGTLQDVRHAWRRLRRSPSFTLTSVVALALGIAAAAAVFSLVHGVVLSPLPYPESERIVEVDHAGPGVGADRGLGIAFGFYRFYAVHTRAAEAIAMYSWLDQTLTGAGEPVRLTGVRATPSLHDVLRVSPRLGRWFTAAEGELGAPLTVVLSHALWRDRFGGDAGVLGRSVELGGVLREVVGVMPAGYAFPSAEAAFWIPRVVPAQDVGGWNELAVARLAAGTDAAMLERELASLLPRLRETTDDPARVAGYLDEARVTPLIRPLKESVVGDVRRTLWVLLGTVGLVLLIAVANVANLFLVRADDAQRDTAVRTALGADRGRVVRGFLAETLLLAGMAGALGVAAAGAAVRILRASAPVNVPRLDEVGLDTTVLAFAVGVTLAAGLLLGTIPALRHRGDPAQALADGGRRTTAGRARRRGRNTLMATQVALALVLLIGSGLLFRTFQALRSVDLGFTTRAALVFEVGLPESRYAARADAALFHDRLLERLRALPGVTSAGAVGQCLPLSGSMCWGETLEAEGRPPVAGRVPPVTGARITTPDYFRTIGIPVRGRGFTEADARGAATAAILSEAAAAAYFGADDPLGRRIRFGGSGPWHTVVGIAGNVHARVETDEFQRTIYLPMLPEAVDGPPPARMAYVLATSVPPTAIVASVRTTIAAIDPAIPIAEVRSLEDHIRRATAPTAFALTMVGLAAALALLLGAVGVYAVVAYTVSRRTAEIGVRMALGARAADVRTLVLRQSGGVVLAGIAIGLIVALALTRVMTGMLYGVRTTDPASWAAVTLLLAAAAALALWLPAHRASRVDPLEALRNE